MLKIKKPIIVLADDLTGCGDVASFSTKKGLLTDIISYDCIDDFKNREQDVLIINIETRLIKEKKAYIRFKRVLEYVKNEFNPDFIFKKMDSTLRGNFAITNDAVFEIYNPDFLPLIAAFPEYGRTTVSGIHYIFGKELANTEFANDPINPVRISSIPKILEKKSKYADKTLVFDVLDAKSFKRSACDIIEKWRKNKTKVKIAAGTSRFFGELIDNFKITTERKHRQGKYKFKNIVIVSGSQNSVTKGQINFLLNQNNFKKSYQNNYIEVFEKTENKANLILVKSVDSYIKNYKLKYLSNFVTEQFQEEENNLFLLCGGATASSLFNKFRIKKTKAIKFIDIGIVLVKDYESDKYFILKPGGFGVKEYLQKIL